MLDLTGGELFVVAFIVCVVVSWMWWLRIGEALAVWLSGVKRPRGTRESDPPGGPDGGPGEAHG